VPRELADQLLDTGFVDGHEQFPSSPAGTTPAGTDRSGQTDEKRRISAREPDEKRRLGRALRGRETGLV
jgi:hypothetical protein